MTKKFLHTDKSIIGKEAKSEFLIPDIYNGTTKLIGLETLNEYEYGLVVYTGIDLNAEEVFKRAHKKKSINILKRNRCKKIIANYLEDIKNLKIGDMVRLNEAFSLEKVDSKKISNKQPLIDFDPIQDYYGMDMSVKTNVVKWNFWEFIKTLVTLSAGPEEQIDIIGIGNVADEMAIDFDTYFTFHLPTYLEYQLLTDEAILELKKLDEYIAERSGNKLPEFWDDQSLHTHPDWDPIRKMAKNALDILEYDDLKIVTERTTEQTTSQKGQPLILESSKSRIIRQPKG